LKWRFNYAYEPLLDLTLACTTFAALDPGDPRHFARPHLKISVGAHNWTYSELRSLGNPGSYQTVVVTASDVAVPGRVGNYSAVQAEIGANEWPDPAQAEPQLPPWDGLLAAQQFRRDTVITTYTVIGMDLWAENYPSTFGPHVNVVRTLP
jgi:hypothetical protein